eukprot:3384383-Rhodomonas_salina.1
MTVCLCALCRAALDNFVKIAEFLIDIAGQDFLAAAHTVLNQGRLLAHEALESRKPPRGMQRFSTMALTSEEKAQVAKGVAE